MSPHTKTILLAATTALVTSSAAFAQSDFRDCLANIKTDAVRQGVPANVVDKAFQGLTPDQKVIDLDGRQPEFTLTYAKYIGNSVTPDRIAKGMQKMTQYKGLLDQMSILPLLSRSTAHLVKVDGMNCMLPMAPAHEPFICCAVMWFIDRMRSACTVSLLKKATRLVMQARVATERTTEKSPM